MPSPNNSLDNSNHNELKKPKFNIGDKVIYCPDTVNGNKQYWRKKYLDYITEDTKRICASIDNLKKNGELRTGNKRAIEKCMNVFDRAYNKPVEIIGIVATSGYNMDNTDFNQCYVNGGTGYSGTQFAYQILIRFKRNKRILALITSIPVGGEYCFKKMK